MGGPATVNILDDDDGEFGCNRSPAANILAYRCTADHKLAANMSCMYYRGPQIVTAELCF